MPSANSPLSGSALADCPSACKVGSTETIAAKRRSGPASATQIFMIARNELSADLDQIGVVSLRGAHRATKQSRADERSAARDCVASLAMTGRRRRYDPAGSQRSQEIQDVL